MSLPGRQPEEGDADGEGVDVDVDVGEGGTAGGESGCWCSATPGLRARPESRRNST